uniref:AP2/ERF domain-containing protein n=1 Tax=Brassica oleracea TaxID=3712 RepID=A0A3P6G492_BRAOL|nr:unnamed protein product [Brassica oleracea]
MIIGTFKATAGVLRYALGMVSLLFPILFWGIQRNPRNSFSFGYWCHFRFLNASCRYALRFVKESRYSGARKRTWGWFSAEISDPLEKSQFWLGIFNSSEEASRA